MNTNHSESAKEYVYQYVRELAGNPSPIAAVDRFYDLLWNRVAPGRDDVCKALQRVVAPVSFKEEEGLLFLNRCFYSIGNLWHLDGSKRPYLRQLIGRLEELPEPAGESPCTVKLRRQLKAFDEGFYGTHLRRQMRLGGFDGYDPRSQQQTGTVGDLLPEHFCLYRSATLTRDIEKLEETDKSNPKSGIANRQLYRLHESWRDIRRYMEQYNQGLTDIKNPTRLPLEELNQGLHHYHPRREGGLNNRALDLQDAMHRQNSYLSARLLVDDYLRSSIEPLPSALGKRLYRCFHEAMRSIEDTVSMVTGNIIYLFNRILDAIFLPDDNISGIRHLQRYLGKTDSMSITSVLLSVVLACPMVRFPLERKLGYLYGFHEDCMLDEVPWVVNFLEHMNLAMVMNAEHLRYFPAV